jgi:soluble lytic murein transglycosylase
MSEVVGLGLRRLSRQDPEKALSLLDRYAHQLRFSEPEKVAIAKEIGLSLARRFDPRALELMSHYDPNLRDNDVSEWRARLLLRLGRWNEAHALIQRMPESLASTSRWRYWLARSLQLSSPNGTAATALFQQLARERDFYGFMAADQANTPYNLTNIPLAIHSGLMNKVRNTPGIRRAIEFHQRGQIVEGRREWYHASRQFNRDELLAQARLAYDMQWYFPAIRTISLAKYWDDLNIRFPVAHGAPLTSEAQKRGLHSSWVFAITRQESAFMADAKSQAGAMGLMQLMPATAKETARKFDIALGNTSNALQPALNIQLGTAYLSQIYGQFNGNRVLASAAYNAGPGRVRQWLRGADHLAYDVWIENIPFNETRQYVQNVLSYAVIYADKLNAPQSLVAWHERYFEQ